MLRRPTITSKAMKYSMSRFLAVEPHYAADVLQRNRGNGISLRQMIRLTVTISVLRLASEGPISSLVCERTGAAIEYIGKRASYYKEYIYG